MVDARTGYSMDLAGAKLPLVSCIMPTMKSRRHFLSQALKYFSRQTYSSRELIVIADPDGPESGDVVSNPYVRYLQTDSRLSLGSKLNLGIEIARGSIIQKLDDDDYYHPKFLSCTVGALRSRDEQVAVVACTSHLVLIAESGELKRRTGNGTVVFAPGTFCFSRKLWQKHPFRDFSHPERLFLSDHEPVRIGIENPELYCVVRHAGGHTWSHFLRSEQKELGAVTAGDDVTEYFRKLPVYSKTLREYIPDEDFGFYENQIEVEKYPVSKTAPGQYAG